MLAKPKRIKNREREKRKSPSGSQFEKHILPPASLSASETDTLLSILCNTPGVTYTPRNRNESRCNNIAPHKWEVLGFYSNYEYECWLGFNLLDKDKYEILEENYAKKSSNY